MTFWRRKKKETINPPAESSDDFVDLLVNRLVGELSKALSPASAPAIEPEAAPIPGPEGLRPPDQTPQGPEERVRKPLALWDRAKWLVLLGIVFFVLVWTSMADDPILPFADAVRLEIGSGWWIFALLGLEALRQIHFLVSERSARYHGFWMKRVFGAFERFTHRRFSPWTRFRLSRAAKWALWLTVFVIVLGKVLDTSPVLAVAHLPHVLWNALPLFIQVFLLVMLGVVQFAAIFWFLARGGVEVYYPDDVRTRFSDVWGQDHVLERVRENVVYLEEPEIIEERGGYVPGGILLWGPPGTGKTLMAEAVAGETGRPYVFVDPGAFINMFFGVGVLKVKSLFRKLRRLALRYGGVIVFFDEADSLGRRGALAAQGPAGQFGHSAGLHGCHGMSYVSDDIRSLVDRSVVRPEPGGGRKLFYGGGAAGGFGGDMGTLQALLTEMSGLKKPRGFFNRVVRRSLGMRPKPPPKYRILIMMATNMPNSLDEALLRPGRIDRIYKVGYPSKPGRVRTYEGYFGKVRHELTDEQIDKLATITPYATGATIKDLVNESLIAAIRDGREVITWDDVMRAKRLKALGPAEDVDYIERERHAVAIHEACHAVMAYRTQHHLEIDVATIEKGSDYLGKVDTVSPEDQFTQWRTEFEADVLVSLASLAGERMFFGEDNSSGVSADLEWATKVVAIMEAYFGMGSGISSLPALQALGIAAGEPQPRGAGGRGIGFGAIVQKAAEPSAVGHLGERIEFTLTRLLAEAERVLAGNRHEVLSLAHALESHKTLNGDDVLAVIEGRPGPLVDGSVYRQGSFAQDLEDYHRAAALAHEGHTKVQLALPLAPGSDHATSPHAVQPSDDSAAT